MDYSKWDSIDVSDDEEDKPKKQTPMVTRLDNPSSITFGGGKTGVVGEKPIEVSSKSLSTSTSSNSTMKNNQEKVSINKPLIKTTAPSTTLKNTLSSSYSKWDNLEVSDDSDKEDEYDSNDEDYEACDDEEDDISNLKGDNDDNNMESEAEEQKRLSKELGLPTPEPKSIPGPKARVDTILDINDFESCYRLA